MAKNTYRVMPTAKGGGIPMLKIRNRASRNYGRLHKRLTNFEKAHGVMVCATLPNGTTVVVPQSATETYTVKREAERAAKRSNRVVVTETSL